MNLLSKGRRLELSGVDPSEGEGDPGRRTITGVYRWYCLVVSAHTAYSRGIHVAKTKGKYRHNGGKRKLLIYIYMGV